MSENKPITPRLYPKLEDLVKTDRLPVFLKNFLNGEGSSDEIKQ